MKMSKYKVNEPSALKFLKANGAVVDENGNVVNEASDYWKKVYEQAEPKVAKYLHADGTIDENPGSGGGADLEDNKEVSITENGTVEITPSAGKDGMKKVTATVNVSGGGGATKLYYFVYDGDPESEPPLYTLSETPANGDIGYLINGRGDEQPNERILEPIQLIVENGYVYVNDLDHLYTRAYFGDQYDITLN